ncbi:MAG: Fe-S cluster assembly sulfur transfer protein SufU [Phycisphaerae bacterium]
MNGFRDLYQEMILDHNHSPRNRRKMETADRSADGHNPLCGDRVTVYLQMDGDTIKDVSFEGSGCAISTASASLMTQALIGKNVAEAKEVFHKFHRLVTGESNPEDAMAELGKLAVFSGVSEYPARVKCATLAWHTASEALEGQSSTVSTE